MKKFNPPISNYSDDELIFITELNSEDWQKEFIISAKKELLKRGLLLENTKKRSLELKAEYNEYIEKSRKYRAELSYTLIDALFTIIFWYRYIFFDWSLKNQGYFKLARQRINYILIGLLGYILFIIWIVNYSSNVQLENEKKIAQAITADSLKQAHVDWSGIYFYSYTHNQNKIEWTLELNKKFDNKYQGTIEILKNNSISKHEIEAVCKEYSVQVFPTKKEIIASHEINSEFDLLFELTIDSEDTLTWWESISPLNEGFENGRINFKKLKATKN